MAVSHTADIVINEALFTVRNYFGKTPRTTVSSVLSGFYTDDEISEAKTVLLSFAEAIEPKIEDLKLIKPRNGGTKRKREAEDIIQIYSLLDAKKISLPMYVAYNDLRIPTFRPEDVDVCTIASNFNTLSAEVKGLTNNVGDLQKQVAEISESIKEIRSHVPAVTNQPYQHLVAGGAANDLLWSHIVNKLPVLLKDTVTYSAAHPNRRLAVGAGKPANLNASKTDKFWHVFVSKLDQGTTENDVSEHLQSSGIRVNKVTRMKPTKEWQRNSAAFRISVALENKDAMFDPNIWPVNVVVRAF
jgi:hypothetical protein